jgi:hypothetical protein
MTRKGQKVRSKEDRRQGAAFPEDHPPETPDRRANHSINGLDRREFAVVKEALVKARKARGGPPVEIAPSSSVG